MAFSDIYIIEYAVDVSNDPKAGTRTVERVQFETFLEAKTAWENVPTSVQGEHSYFSRVDLNGNETVLDCR
jgi:hypothetical protein